MWSHTIGSSKPKGTPAKPARRANTSPTEKPLPEPPPKDDIPTQSFGADGFSKTSRIHTSKKPVTVPKAPILGRTASNRTERQPTESKEATRPGLEKRGSQVVAPPPTRVGAGTPVRSTNTATPTQPPAKTPRTGAGVPGRHQRTATPTSPASKTSRGGTPAQVPPGVRNPKSTAATKSRSHATLQPSKPKLVSNNAKPASPVQDDDSIEGEGAQEDEQVPEPSVDGAATDSATEWVELQRAPSPEDEINKGHTSTNGLLEGEPKPGVDQAIQSPTKGEADAEFHGELSREIALRNETIRKLRREITFLQTAHERKVEKIEQAAADQVQSLRLELDSVRGTLVDLDDKHRSLLESHEETLRAKDEEIQSISSDALHLQRRVKATDKAKNEGDNKYQELVRSKDNEIRRLSEVTQNLEDKLKIGDGIKEPGGVDKDRMYSNEEEIAKLTQTTRDLEDKLKAAEETIKQVEDDKEDRIQLLDEENQTIAQKNEELQHELEASKEATRQADSDRKDRIVSMENEIQRLAQVNRHLEDKLRATDLKLDEDNEVLEDKFEEIRRLSFTIQDLQGKLEATTTASERDHEHVRNMTEEVQGLSQISQALQEKLKEADSGQGEHDRVIESKDDEIQGLKKATQDLLETLQAADSARVEHEQIVKSKDEEIERISTLVMDLQEKLKASEKVKDQEVDHSVRSLRDEFQDLQVKHKRKIEEVEAAAAARRNILQREYDELLKSKNQEVQEMEALVQDVEEKVEKAREIEKEESRKASFEHERQLREKSSQYEDQIRDMNEKHVRDFSEANEIHQQELAAVKADCQELQDKASEFKHKLRDMTNTYEQELELLRAVVRNADEKHDQELKEMAANYEHELRSLRDENTANTRDVIMRHETELRDVVTKHELDMESLSRKYQDEIAAPSDEHAQNLKDAAAKHEQELQEIITTHKQKLEDLNSTHGQGVEDAARKHETEIKNLTEKHRNDLDEANRKQEELQAQAQQYQQESRAAVSKYESDLEEAAARYDKLRSEADRSQEELEKVTQKHKQEINNLVLDYDSKIAEATKEIEKSRSQSQNYHQELQDLVQKHEQEILEQRKKNVELIDAGTKRAQKIDYLRAECTEAVTQITELQRSTKEKDLERSRAGEAMANDHQEKLRDLAAKHEEEIKHMHEEFQTAAHEISSLKSILKQKDIELAKLEEDIAREHKQALRDLSVHNEQEASHLRVQLDITAGKAASLEDQLRDLQIQQSEAANDVDVMNLEALLITLFDSGTGFDFDCENYVTSMQRSKHGLFTGKNVAELDIDQVGGNETTVAMLRSRVQEADFDLDNTIKVDSFLRFVANLLEARDPELERIDGLQKTLDEVNLVKTQMGKELDALKQNIEAIRSEREEAIADIAQLQEKLLLADSQNQDKGDQLAALQNDLKELQFHIDNSSANMDHERNEAAVEIALLKDKLDLAKLQRQNDNEDADREKKETAVELALLKDKLELAELQNRQAKEDSEAERNEAAIEIAPLKGKLELAELQNRKCTEEIAALQKELEALQVQLAMVPEIGPYTAHQLREELGILGRHHSANLADAVALKASIALEREERQKDYLRRAMMTKKIMDDLKGITTELALQ